MLMWLPCVLVVVLITLAYALLNFFKVKAMDEGTERMSKIAQAIRLGANTFINYEYKVILIVVIVIAGILTVLVSWQSAVAMLLGVLMSAIPGWLGMKIATYANVRVTNEARLTKNIGRTLKVAFRGGSVMGLCVAACALLGLFLVYLIFGIGLGQLSLAMVTKPTCNWLGIKFIPFTMTLSGFALGCSTIAMFNRVGGGIYTKAADMGADLVGKVEAHIPEDDPRNPATIADNVGDNVGDVAGLGSDLLESYVGAIVAAIILAFNLYLVSCETTGTMSETLLEKMYLFPLIFTAIGLAASVLGICWLLARDLSRSKKVHFLLNLSTWFAAGLTLAGTLVASLVIFAREDLTMVSFRLGAISPWIGAAIGVIAGVVIGRFAEYYTSTDYRPTVKLADSALEGPALTITAGLSLGMRSCFLPCLILGGSIIIAYFIAGYYGVGMAAVGMLSFVAVTVTVDTYGPIADNAGGIAEMSELDEEVRQITDTLDSVGNTTAAIGKGFAIGSGGLAALALLISYLYAYNDPTTPLILNMIEPMTLAGAIIGGALPFLFSGILIEAVTKAARKMVEEVRRQFREIKGLLEGTSEPDYKTCIEIATKGALSEMKVSALLAVVIPVISGFVFGPEFVGGILIGSTICSIMLAVFTGNAGGAWDNGKKFIEAGGIKGCGKNSPAHDAAIVGDTVGDPLKDTVGPCLDIFIKIMATTALVTAPVFSHYNLVGWIIQVLTVG